MKNKFWSTVWKYANSFKKNIYITIIFSMMTGIAVAIQPLVIKFIVDNGIMNDALNKIDKIVVVLQYCFLFILLATFRMLFWSIGYRNALVSIEGFLFNLRSEVYIHIQSMCFKFYEKHPTGELINYIMGSPMGSIKTFLQQAAVSVPYQLVALIISLSTLIYFDWLLTSILLLVIICIVILNYYSKKKIKTLALSYLQTETEASRFITDMLHGMQAIKLYAIEDDIFQSYEEYTSMMRLRGIKLSFSQALEHFKPEYMQYIGTAIIYLIGAVSCVYRGLTTGVLFAFVTSMTNILNIFNSWMNLNLIKSNAEAGMDKIIDLLDEKSSIVEPSKQVIKSVNNEKLISNKNNLPCINFNNITFSYGNKCTIYNKINCKIKYNESIALVGSSGSGKSTFTKLAMRLYDVDEGIIKLHNRDVKEYGLHDLRSDFGIVPQEPYLFQASVLDNIRIARPESSLEQVKEAMEIAHITEFVNELPDGLNTLIGEGGYGISGGQKQRIAIARAVLGKPSILIFDEATSALDNVSERLIQKSMESLMKNHTVIIIAHRLSTIRNVDRILVFNHGTICQEGSYDQLANVEGVFRDLLTLSNT